MSLNKIIESNKYKTNYVQIRYIIDASKENITLASLLCLYMIYVNNKLDTNKKVIQYLDSLYGCRVGNNINIKADKILIDFYVSFISNRYLKQDNNYIENIVNTFIDFIVNPLINNGSFDKQIFELKKYELDYYLRSLYDDKQAYALDNFLNVFAKDYPLSLNNNGYLDILNKINNDDLYSFYQKNIIESNALYLAMINSKDSKIVNALINEKLLFNDSKNYNINNYSLKPSKLIRKIDKQDITQSKLFLGYSFKNDNIDLSDYYSLLVFNAIFGMSSNSLLFKIIREKEQLCYSIRSNYDHYSNTIIVSAGIDKLNYDKTITTINDIVLNFKTYLNEEVLKEAKIVLNDILNKTNDSQVQYINYLMNRAMLKMNDSINDDIELINKVSLEDIINVVENINLNTIYMLSGEKNE